MRYRFIVLMIVSVLLVMMAACSEGGEGDTSSGENESVESGQEEQNGAAQDADSQTDSEQLETDGDTDENHRIVTTTVAITEIMDELELDLVGVPTSYKDLPERYQDATDTGNPMSPDMEVVLSLNPTEVFSVTTLLSDLEASFAEHDVPAYFVNLTSTQHMFDEIVAIGEKYNRTEQAESLVESYEQKIEQMESQIEGLDSPSVLILMGIPGSYIVGTEHSYIGDLVERLGGTNVIEDRDEEYISANTEYLQQLNPDIILRAAHGAPEEVVKMFDREFSENDIWKHFKAVQDERVYDLEETRFGTTANLAIDEALEELFDMLYPDVQ